MNYVTQAEVVSIIDHSENVKEYELLLQKERQYNPGSFVQLTLDLVTASDIWPDSRTFSIASYQKGVMRFIIQNTGEYTNRIFNELSKGTKCTLKYPFGDLFNKKLIHEQHLFLAGGLGITPYLGMVKYYESVGLINNIALFYSVRHMDNLLHYNELKKSLGDKLEIFVTREKNSEFHNNRITIDDIERIANRDSNIYICGNKIFNNELSTLLFKKGYTKIHMDEWD